MFRGPPTHMHPVTSNHGGRLTNRVASTVEKNFFHMVPQLFSCHTGVVYTIRLKIVYLDHFRPYYAKSDDRV